MIMDLYKKPYTYIGEVSVERETAIAYANIIQEDTSKELLYVTQENSYTVMICMHNVNKDNFIGVTFEFYKDFECAVEDILNIITIIFSDICKDSPNNYLERIIKLIRDKHTLIGYPQELKGWWEEIARFIPKGTITNTFKVYDIGKQNNTLIEGLHL